MRHYGNVKGFTYRNRQPEPMLTCKACGKKHPEREYLDANGRRLGLCPKCRRKQRKAYERLLERDAERRAINARTQVCAKCGKRKPIEHFKGHLNGYTKCCKECRDKQIKREQRERMKRIARQNAKGKGKRQ